MPNQTVHHPRLVILFLAIGAFAIGITEFATMTLLPQMANYFHIDEPTAGHLISAYALGVVFGAPVLALILSNWPRRHALVACMLFFFIMHIACIFAPSYHTLLLMRFLAGLPHGAYLGISGLLAGGLMGHDNRGKAVARVIMGLTLATVIGAPITNYLGQSLDWRIAMATAAIASLMSGLGLITFIPRAYRQTRSDVWHEIGALGNPQIWLTLGCGAIGFGGMFAVYTYLASLLEINTHVNTSILPWVFCAMGCGLTVGNAILGYFTDKSIRWSVIGILTWSIFWLATFPSISHSIYLVMPWVLCIGMGGGIATTLQVRLMDVAGNAQTMAAALNHSAFNTANALGPFLAGLAIEAGYDFPVVGYVGAILAAGGLIIWFVALSWDAYLMKDHKQDKI